MSRREILILIGGMVLGFVLIQSCQSSQKQKEESEQTVDTHLGELMGQMQYYTVKLGLALEHHNQPLAAFYINEVNETYQDIVDKKITHESYKVSDMIQQILSTSKERLEN